MRALKTVADANIRADAVIAHERKVRAQADAARSIMSDAIHRFAGDVLKLSHRFDQFEQRRIADALRDLPDADHPEGLSKAAQDDLEAICEAPGPKHREREQELAEAEDVIGDQNPGDLPRELLKGVPAQPGNYLTLGEPERQVPQLAAVGDAAPGRIMKRWEKRKRRKSHDA
jgi:hypothetical protein